MRLAVGRPDRLDAELRQALRRAADRRHPKDAPRPRGAIRDPSPIGRKRRREILVAVVGELELSSRRLDGLDIDLEAARLVGRIRDERAVRRERRAHVEPDRIRELHGVERERTLRGRPIRAMPPQPAGRNHRQDDDRRTCPPPRWRRGPVWRRDRLRCGGRDPRRFDWCNEPIADRRDGLDVARLLRVVADCLADLRHDACERVVSDERARPDGLEDLLFGDDAVAMLDEELEKAKRLGLERLRYAVDQYAKRRRLDADRIESPTARRAGGRCHRRHYQSLVRL